MVLLVGGVDGANCVILSISTYDKKGVKMECFINDTIFNYYF